MYLNLVCKYTQGSFTHAQGKILIPQVFSAETMNKSWASLVLRCTDRVFATLSIVIPMIIDEGRLVLIVPHEYWMREN